MYQLIFSTEDGRGLKFAANINSNMASFLVDYVQDLGGFTRFNVDVYNDHVTAESYEDYGRFMQRKELLKWLYENVFMADYDSLDSFKSWFYSTYKEWKHDDAIEDLAIGVLMKWYCHDSYVEAESIWKKISGIMPESIWKSSGLPTTKEMKGYIKNAFVDFVKNH